eukprot:355754-Chlamydomonas_euryale.AAC.14
MEQPRMLPIQGSSHIQTQRSDFQNKFIVAVQVHSEVVILHVMETMLANEVRFSASVTSPELSTYLRTPPAGLWDSVCCAL